MPYGAKGAPWDRKNVPFVVWTNGTFNRTTRPSILSGGASEYRSIRSGFPLRALNTAWVMREYRGAVHTYPCGLGLSADAMSSCSMNRLSWP